MSQLWRVTAVTVADRLVPADAPVAVDLDDTLLHKTGRRVEGAGVVRDAVRSTRNRVVHALGLNLVVVTVRVAPPWGGMPVGLPVNVRVRRKDRDTPSFADALAALRRLLWQQRISAVCSTAPLPTEIIRPLIDTLARAA